MDLGYFNRSTNMTIAQLEAELWEHSGHADIRNFIYVSTTTYYNDL